MSGVLSFEQAREQLAALIQTKNVALALGAGASVSSGAPVSRDLVDRIRARFPLCNLQMTATLFDAGQAVSETPPYGRQELVQFVNNMLDSLTPSDSYKQLPRVRWRGLFTTNYDDLIEKAYKAPSRVQTLQPVDLAYGPTIVPRDNHVLLFYLMGSILAGPTTDQSPVLSWADFLRSVQQREPILKLLRNILVDGGKLIYVGYSFNDFVLDGVLDEALRLVGTSDMPYGYAILNNWPQDRAQPYQKMLMKKVIPVDGTFEDFADLVKDIADGSVYGAGGKKTQPPTSPATGQRLRVGKHLVALSENQAGVFSEAFEVVDDAALTPGKLSTDAERELAAQFYKGHSLGWLPFQKDWAIKREGYQEVLSNVKQACLVSDAQQNSVHLVHGPAGLGKSVMARQLAFDLPQHGGIPVLLAKPNWRARPDLKLLDRFFDDLESAMPNGERFPAVVLLIDEAELVDREMPFRASSYLRSRGRAINIVLFARTNEYYRPTASQSADQISGFRDLVEHHLKETISPTEIRALLDRLQASGNWDERRISDEAFWISYITNELKSSFFEAVYSLISQSQERLRDRVWSEHENLSQIGRRAYTLIAATHQFGMPLKMEVLMRALGASYADFEAGVIKSDARNVLFTEHASNEMNLYFRGRTRLISQVVFERALPEKRAQLDAFKAIVRATNPNEMFGIDELDSLRTLLVQVFGPSGFDARFSPAECGELFEVACSIVQDDVLEHHYGLVEREAERLVSARDHLLKALQLSATLPSDLATLRESPQNIENSLAQVIGALALDAIRRNDKNAASQLFDEARQHFLNARRGAFPNAAAYDAHARMLRVRAQRLFLPGSAERAIGLSEALDVLSEGIDNVNDDFKPDLVELRGNLLEELGQHGNAIADLEKLAAGARPVERARYEVLLARLYVGSEEGKQKPKHLKRAYIHAIHATEADPNYFEGWKLRAMLFGRLFPRDYKELVALLEKALDCAEGGENSWVLYELGVMAFSLEQYETAAKTFAQLRRASRGHHKMSGVVELAGERDGGDPFEYTGRVVRSDSGRLAIKSEQLAALNEIWFNPKGERYYTPRVADQVSFLIGFNYGGPLATEIKRI